MPITKKPNGYVLYQGPSQLDGQPIVLIMTGVRTPSSNPKTGWLMQTWSLRSDIHPLEAVHSNQDVSICGSCPLKGDGGKNRVCYVNLAGPGQIYKSYLAGQYPNITDADYQQFRYRGVRLGAYGDPAAVPFEVWDKLIRHCSFHTGYTNQWREGKIDERFKQICMASCMSVAEQQLASQLGWRTYRVRRANESKLPGEIICPASEEMGYQKTCMTCGLCSGAGKPGANICITVHGSRAKYFESDFISPNLESEPITKLKTIS